MVKHLLVAFAVTQGLGWKAQAFGQSSSPGGETSEMAFIGRIVLATGLKADMPALAKLIYPDVADTADTAFSVTINTDIMKSREGKSLDQDTRVIQQLQLAAEGDAVLRRDGSDWELVRATDEGSLVSLGKAQSELIMGQALRVILGYDGVVIAQEGRTVFAQTPDLSGKADLYAVAVNDSQARFVVKDGEKVKRSALLRLIGGRKVAGHGTISSFRVVSSKKTDPLPIGTKIRIEKWQ